MKQLVLTFLTFFVLDLGAESIFNASDFKVSEKGEAPIPVLSGWTKASDRKDATGAVTTYTNYAPSSDSPDDKNYGIARNVRVTTDPLGNVRQIVHLYKSVRFKDKEGRSTHREMEYEIYDYSLGVYSHCRFVEAFRPGCTITLKDDCRTPSFDDSCKTMSVKACEKGVSRELAEQHKANLRHLEVAMDKFGPPFKVENLQEYPNKLTEHIPNLKICGSSMFYRIKSQYLALKNPPKTEEVQVVDTHAPKNKLPAKH